MADRESPSRRAAHPLVRRNTARRAIHGRPRVLHSRAGKPGDEPRPALEREIFPRSVEDDHKPVAEPDEEIDVPTHQMNQAIKPVSRNGPICTTAYLRPIVASDP